MVVVCPKCNSHIQEEYIDNEENTCHCVNCEKTFDLSYLLNTEETEQIEEIFTNPPEDLKIEKDTEKINIKFHIHSLGNSLIIAFSFLLVFTVATHFFRIGINSNGLFSTFVGLVLFLGSIWLLYSIFYSAFGRIELVFGKENYIFQGFWRIGKKIDLDWKDVKNFFPRYSLNEDEGHSDYRYFGHLIIGNREISVRELDKKIYLLLLIIKYFKNKAISESDLSNNAEIIINQQPHPKRKRYVILIKYLHSRFKTLLKRLKVLLRRKFLSIKPLNTNKNHEDTIGSYNNCAKYFSEKISKLTIYNITYDYLIKTLNENDNILDLACKTGQISKYIKERINVNITGVDQSTEMLNIAKENIPDGTFIEDSIVTFKSDILYDYIIIGFGISCLNNEQTTQCIENSISLLKKSGHIYLSFTNGDKEYLEKTSFEGNNNFYIYYHEKEKIKEILLKNGVEIKTDYNIEYKEADGRITNDVIFIAAQACTASSGVDG
ncbi:MAG: class I SAM-dependent methyltransferase [Treponema sp.]|jgi:ubiquinone/menaquinone biosynthesis C-methylase UbiE|nr:class I SAM-dependent methyltransferase [Treponema sp.]